MSRLWPALRSVNGFTTSYAEWRQRLGDELSLWNRYLLPTNQIAGGVPDPWITPSRSIESSLVMKRLPVWMTIPMSSSICLAKTCCVIGWIRSDWFAILDPLCGFIPCVRVDRQNPS